MSRQVVQITSHAIVFEFHESVSPPLDIADVKILVAARLTLQWLERWDDLEWEAGRRDGHVQRNGACVGVCWLCWSLLLLWEVLCCCGVQCGVCRMVSPPNSNTHGSFLLCKEDKSAMASITLP